MFVWGVFVCLCEACLYVCVRLVCKFLWCVFVCLCEACLYVCVKRVCMFVWGVFVCLCEACLYVCVKRVCMFVWGVFACLCEANKTLFRNIAKVRIPVLITRSPFVILLTCSVPISFNETMIILLGSIVVLFRINAERFSFSCSVYIRTICLLFSSHPT